MDNTANTDNVTYYGATYSTDPDNFGEITNVFEVEPDWNGNGFHGYCRLTPKAAAEELAKLATA